MGSQTEILAKLAGRFPGESEDTLGRLVEGLVRDGSLAPLPPDLLARLQGSAPAQAAPKPTLAPVAVPTPAAAPAPASAPVASAVAPARPVMPAPTPAAVSASSQRNDPVLGEGEAEQAFDAVLAGDEDSGLFGAVAETDALSTSISRNLPALESADAAEDDEGESADEDDLLGELTRGGDETLEEEDADDEAVSDVADELAASISDDAGGMGGELDLDAVVSGARQSVEDAVSGALSEQDAEPETMPRLSTESHAELPPAPGATSLDDIISGIEAKVRAEAPAEGDPELGGLDLDSILGQAETGPAYERAHTLGDDELLDAADQLLEDIAGELQSGGHAVPDTLVKRVGTRKFEKG